MAVEEGVALRSSKMQERDVGSNDSRHGKAERGKMEWARQKDGYLVGRGRAVEWTTG